MDLDRLFPRLIAAFVGAAALASATLTFAAVGGPRSQPKPHPAKPHAPRTLRVPNVTGQAYVFAKGILEDAGFAWRVAGSVDGYAANSVVRQVPKPGAKVLDNGAPTLTLYLARNGDYKEQGTPENYSPYSGSRAVLVGVKVAPKLRGGKLAPQAKAKPKKVAKAKHKKSAKGKHRSASAKRPPAFITPGAPKEPLDEMPLPDRALMLSRWVEAHPSRTDANVKHWLYQHAWIVYGAKFGWWHGSEALETLIRVDARVQKLWGLGAKSSAEAKQALAEVRAKSR